MRDRIAEDHPRLRGEHVICPHTSGLPMGSPPLTRGTHLMRIPDRSSGRITPAYAGNTSCTQCGYSREWDHPRLRGEHALNLLEYYHNWGSPPLTRGTLGGNLYLILHPGITPAYAGNTHYPCCRFLFCWDHPRLRGEHTVLTKLLRLQQGSPPLTRGTPSPLCQELPDHRITGLSGNK